MPCNPSWSLCASLRQFGRSRTASTVLRLPSLYCIANPCAGTFLVFVRITASVRSQPYSKYCSVLFLPLCSLHPLNSLHLLSPLHSLHLLMRFNSVLCGKFGDEGLELNMGASKPQGCLGRETKRDTKMIADPIRRHGLRPICRRSVAMVAMVARVPMVQKVESVAHL